jgi:hypothetical protein
MRTLLAMLAYATIIPAYRLWLILTRDAARRLARSDASSYWIAE